MPDFFNMTELILDRPLSYGRDKVVLRCGTRSWTRGELIERCNRFGHLYASAGLTPGDRVAIVMPNCLAWAAAYLGAVRAGFVPIGLHAIMKRFQIEEVLRHCEATALVTQESVESAGVNVPSLRLVLNIDDERLDGTLAPHSPEQPAHRTSPDDLAFMLYTSGSTGHPKGVPHRHQDFIPMFESCCQDLLPLHPEDLVFCPSPFSYTYGLITNLFYTPASGAECILLDKPISPTAVLDTLFERRPNVFLSVPTMINFILPLLDEQRRPDFLRISMSSGEPLPASLLEQWIEKTGVEILNGYGASEAGTFCVGGVIDPLRPEVSGHILKRFEGKIVDRDGRELPDGEQGVLAVRGPALFQGYWGDEEWTRRTRLEGDWWYSGDRYRRERNDFIFLGRDDDMLRIGGAWVAPVVVENALLEHPQVKECAVASVTVGGLTQPRAHVVLADGLTPGMETVGVLRRHVLERLPKYMCPSSFQFHEELPKTITGKIQRFRLRQAANAAEGDAS
jgi:benzoate-CoA ligase